MDPAFTWDAAWAADFGCTDDPAGRLRLLLDRQAPAARTRIAARLGVDPRPLEELAALAGQQAELLGASRRPSPPACGPMTRLTWNSIAAARPLRSPPSSPATWRPGGMSAHCSAATICAPWASPRGRATTILAALRDARLDGHVQSRDDESPLSAPCPPTRISPTASCRRMKVGAWRTRTPILPHILLALLIG